MNRWLVVLVGFAVVFIGLMALVLIIKLLSAVVGMSSRSEQKIESDNKVAGSSEVELNHDERRKLIAAISAAVALSMDTTPNGIRIYSIKKIGK